MSKRVDGDEEWDRLASDEFLPMLEKFNSDQRWPANLSYDLLNKIAIEAELTMAIAKKARCSQAYKSETYRNAMPASV